MLNLAFMELFLYIRAMNMVGLIASFGFIGVIVGSGFFMARSKSVKPEFIRKFIHIGVSNWWFLLLWGFDNIWFALVGPVFFIVANTIAVFTGFADVLGISDRRRNYGLIYYPISLLLLVAAGFLEILPFWACGIGVFAMGYGDGFAAVFGKKWGHSGVNGKPGGKTLVGSIVMFAITFLVVVGFSLGYNLQGLWSLHWWLGVMVVALGSALLEAFTPSGFDNISVPLGTALIAALVFVA
jgi:phytol kinase